MDVEGKENPVVAKMTPHQKLEASLRLYWSARALKEAAIRAQHPAWNDAQVKRAVRDAFLLHRD